MRIWQGSWGAVNQLLHGRREVLDSYDLFYIEWAQSGEPYRVYGHGADGSMTEVTDCVVIEGEVDAV